MENHPAIIHINQLLSQLGELEISSEEVAYNNSDFLASYELLQVPDRHLITKVFHGNQL